MPSNTKPEGNSRSGRGDRIVQIVLLSLIGLGIIGIPLILIGNAAAGAASAGGPPGGFSGAAGGEESEEKAAAVNVAEAVLGDVREYVRVNGDVDAESSVSIYPDVSGKLVSISVSPGDSVRRGQAIAVVDPSLPGQVYGLSTVLSTINGTVTSVNVDIGETVGTSTAVASVGNLSSLKVVTYVPERYVGSVSLGMEAEVVLDAYPEASFRARVAEVSPVLDLSSRSQEVSLAFVDSDPRIKVGMFATTRIAVREALAAVTVPTAAVTSYYEQDVVFVIADGVAERRDVTLGLSSSGAVEVVEGLDAGETVVVRGLTGITDGARVRIVE